MFGRRHGVKDAVAGAAGSVSGYADPLIKDEKLRRRIAAAVAAGVAARERARRQTGLSGLASRLAADAVLRAQLLELVTQLQGAKRRAEKSRSHRLRNTVFFVSGVGMVIAAFPEARNLVLSRIRDRRGAWAPGLSFDGSTQTTIDEEIEVDVPISTAYNQWTQFEEFPRFMAGVDEVRQLDDTLLHWAATVGGKHAEWDAKIIEQEPDRRITWESTEGKPTRGTVSFEEAGPGRSRIRLHMSYGTEGVTEMVGSAVGLDKQRVRGDLQRFRQLIESQQVESGAWRGAIKDGNEQSDSN
jgi:uncharacterized membrane protein